LGDGIIEMIRTTVDKTLGCSRWDQRIVELLESRIGRPEGFEYFGGHDAVLGRLSAMAVEAKHALSAAPSTAVQARTVGQAGGEYIDLDTSLTRIEVEQATTDLTARLTSILRSAAQDLLSTEGLDRVIVTGGGANWPANTEGLRRDLGDGVSVMVRSPDLVARGAALQAGVLTGAIRDLLLLDVTSERLSVVDSKGQTAIEIVAGTTIPTRTSGSLRHRRAEHVDLRVVEGESPEPKENRLLGGIGYTAKGEVEGVLDIDANGVLGLKIIDPARGGSVAQWSSGGEADEGPRQQRSETHVRSGGKVFISYAREDEVFIAQVGDVLTQAGIPVWVDTMIEAGANWDLVIEDELAHCKVLIVILSPASVGSRHVRNELSVALGDEKPVIPVLYRECRIPWNLRLVQHVDFTDSDESNRSFDHLLQVVKASL
jgi:molecular chaperone DnaK (HSP70)